MKFKYYLRGAGIGMIAATVILSVVFLFQDNVTDEEVIRRAMALGMVMQEDAPGTLADYSKESSKADLETALDDTAADSDENGGPADASGADKPDAADGADADAQDASDKSGTDGGDGADKADASSGEKNDTPKEDDTSAVSAKPKASEPKASDPKASDQKASGQKNTDQKDTAQKDTDQKSGKKNTDAPAADGKVTVTVNSGDVSRAVSEKVQEAGLVENAEEFNSYMGANGYASLLQPGTYEIANGSSFQQIADILTGRR